MILPHPESDMRLNVMVLGADIIKILQSKRKESEYILVENVMTAFLKEDKKRTPDTFIYSLIFLFSIGLIEQKGYKIKLTPQIVEQQTKLLF